MTTKFSIAAFILGAVLSVNVSAQELSTATPHQHQEPEFRPNSGQWEGDFSHLIFLPRYAAYLTPEGVAVSMNPIEEMENYHDAHHEDPIEAEQLSIPGFSYEVNFAGVNAEAEILGEGESSMYRNYFIGSDSAKWKSGIKDVKRVWKQDFYNSIDVLYKVGKRLSLEFDYIVKPGGDPADIQWSYNGVEATISGKDLAYKTPYGKVKEYIPAAYQEIDGKRISVDVQYAESNGVFSFEVGEYNPAFALVIDPIIVASTLTGTTGSSNYGHGATYDEEGNIYSFGRAFGAGVPTSPGVVQPGFNAGFGVNVVINKFNPTGTDQLYATYLGAPDASTLPHSAVTNLFGDLFVFGTVEGDGFPVTNGALQTTFGGDIDIFISRLSADGTELVGSTYLGRTGVDGRNQVAFGYDAFRGEVSLDSEGNVYLASVTTSDDLPISTGAVSTDLNGSSDGLVAKITPSLGSLYWTTLIGGSGDDMVYGVRVNDNFEVVISGATTSSDFPTTSGVYQEDSQGTGNVVDAFAAVINPTGTALNYSTFASTAADDEAFFVDLDNDDNIWIYGRTGDGDNWPVTEGVFTTDAKSFFITQFNPSLSEVMVSTCFGSNTGFGGSAGNPVAFLVDRCDRVYISAYGATGNLPLTDDALFQNGGFYLAAFEDALETLSFATYYTESHVDGGTSRFDKKGVVYQGVCSGGGFNTNADAYATDQSIGWDVGVFKIDFELSGVNAAISAPSELDGCVPHTVQFSNFSVGNIYEWDFGDSSPISNEFEPEHEFTEPGVYTVTLIASDEFSCNLADTVSVTIDIFSPTDFTPSFDINVNCESGTASMINTTGGESFLDFYWIINGDTLYESYNATHTFANLSDQNTVGLHAIDEGCELDETVFQDVSGLSEVSAEIGNVEETYCGLEISLENTSSNGQTYLWDFGDGQTSTEVSPTHVYDGFGNYDITLTAYNQATCNMEDQTVSNVNFVVPPQIDDNIEISQTGNCADFNIFGEMPNTDNIESVTWYLNSNEIGEGQDFNTQVEAQGLYTVEAEIIPLGCPNVITVSDTIRVVSELDIETDPDKSICYYEDAVEIAVQSEFSDAEYLWSPGGETTSSISVSEPGEYSVMVVTGTCADSRTIRVGLGERTLNNFELTFCNNRNAQLSIPIPFREIRWEDGSTEPYFYTDDSGTYNFDFVDMNGCDQEGSIDAIALESDPLVYIPNAFTPNGDGLNDLFKPASADLDMYELKIFNRWGDLIFETEDSKKGWNGADPSASHYASTNVYVYLIKYSSKCSTDVIEKSGNITVLR